MECFTEAWHKLRTRQAVFRLKNTYLYNFIALKPPLGYTCFSTVSLASFLTSQSKMIRFALHLQFIESWKKLSKTEQDSIYRLLQMLKGGNITPGMRSHKVGAFLSLSPNMDLRIIALTRDDKVTLMYVGHHDNAYEWAKQKFVLDSEFGTTEIIQINDIPDRQYSANHDYVLPIPIQEILSINDDELFLNTISSMSPEWQEWLLNEYKNIDGTKLPPPIGSSLIFSPVNDEELIKALKLDIPNWQLFLHPSQRQAIDDLSSQSMAVLGGPGTGKTSVLLNRLLTHAPKGKDQDCSILMTYSANLATHLVDLLGAKSNRYYCVLPMYFLGGQRPSHTKQETIFRKYRLIVQEGQVFLKYNDGSKRHVRELLIDEFQDVPNEVAQTLQSIIAAGVTKCIVAADLDQSIHRLNQNEVKSTIDLCHTKYDLTYCYRSTYQIIQKAKEWLSSFGLQPSSSDVFALSGPSVRFISTAKLENQVKITADIVRDLKRRYKPSEIAVIFCQYFNPSFKGISEEEDALKSQPDIKDVYHFASTTKGKEYFVGVLFISDSFLKKNVGNEAKRLRINTLYVALTRFRDEVAIVYLEECSIESHLRELALSTNVS